MPGLTAAGSVGCGGSVTRACGLTDGLIGAPPHPHEPVGTPTALMDWSVPPAPVNWSACRLLPRPSCRSATMPGASRVPHSDSGADSQPMPSARLNGLTLTAADPLTDNRWQTATGRPHLMPHRVRSPTSPAARPHAPPDLARSSIHQPPAHPQPRRFTAAPTLPAAQLHLRPDLTSRQPQPTAHSTHRATRVPG